eukprot:3359-Heterococcus_DN1.PRE.1
MPSIGPPFAATLDFSKLAEGVYFVVAEATVDQNWAGKTKSSRHPNPDIPPQSKCCAGAARVCKAYCCELCRAK